MSTGHSVAMAHTQQDGICPGLVDTVCYRSIAHLLELRAESCDGTRGYWFGPHDEPDNLNWKRLYERAFARAQVIAGSTAEGDRVVVACRPGSNYVINLFACFLAGRIAVPAYPPKGKRHAAMFEAIITNCAPAIIILDEDTLTDRIVLNLEQHGAKLLDAKPNECEHHHSSAVRVIPSPGRISDVAILQYTSGSTGRPRGVCQTHANLLHNLSWQQRLYEVGEHSRAVIWLPPYHDMGLGSGILQPLYSNSSVLLLDPKKVARDPFIWLNAISDFGADISGAPTFAYELATKSKLRSPERYSEINLGGWRTAFIGAEPIHLNALAAFVGAFSENDFNERSFVPSYGLAEATLLVTGRRGLATATIGGKERVSCGWMPGNGELITVDPATGAPVQPGDEGEICVASDSNTNGYWGADHQQTSLHRKIFGDSRLYLSTGDLGVIIDGEVFITGRLKSTLIVRGKNIHLEDIESQMLGSTGDILGDPSTAIAIPIFMQASWKLCLVIEVSAKILADAGKLEEASVLLRQEIGALFEIGVAHVVFERVGLLPRTSSGKIAREACAERITEALFVQRTAQ